MENNQEGNIVLDIANYNNNILERYKEQELENMWKIFRAIFH